MKLSSIAIFSLLIVATYLQTPQLTQTNQNYIDPTVVNVGTSPQQPAIPTNDQPQQPQINNQQPPQSQGSNQRPPQQGVLLSNANLPGLEGEAIPVDQAQINEAINEPKPQLTEQAMAKAKQQAEKAKQMANHARRQAQGDRKSRDKQQDEQLHKLKFDQTLSKTQRKKQQERLLFRKISRSVEQGTRFTQYLFEQGLGASQFFIKIPAAQQVALNLYTYISQDNTYVRTKNIEQEEPVKVYIYENNQNIVHEGQFYYQTYIVFQGQPNAMYLIKIVNNGRTKLISMNTKKLVQETHLEQTLQQNDGQHVQRTQNLAIEISRWHQEFRKIRMLDFQDLKSVQGFIEKYYSWQLMESMLAIFLCIFQVKMIQSMFKGNSIV